ncbi:MAG: DUF2298 domain-containing protein [Ilumatobacteraceae bacterium]
MEIERSRAVAWWLLLTAVAMVGLALRTSNIDWDEGQHLHPDERHWSFVLDGIEAPGSVVDYFDTSASPLSPYRVAPSFVYGTLPLFATKAVAGALHAGGGGPVVTLIDRLGIDLIAPDGSPRFDADYNANLIGRLLSALVDSVTVVLVGVIGLRLGGRRVGLMAAAAYATAVLAIQQSHFLGPDTWATIFTTATVLAVLTWVQRRTVGALVGAGALIGAAVSSRVTAVLILSVVASAIWTQRHTLRRRDIWAIAGAGLAALVTFRVASPYAFDGWWLNPAWRDDLRSVRDSSNSVTFPPTIQWVGRPLLYPFAQIVKWGLGPGLSALAGVGAVSAFRRWKRTSTGWLLASWPIGWVLLALDSNANTLRYLLPIYPLLCLAAGLGFVGLIDAAGDHRIASWRRYSTNLAVVSLSVLAVGWTVAFSWGVYGHTNSRVAASRWIEQHVKPDEQLTSDVWDDSVPLRLPGVTERTTIQLEPFLPDSHDKVLTFVGQLDAADVIAVTSQRARLSVVRLPVSYPAMIRYYDALDSGSIGLEPVAQFQNLPRLGPFVIDTVGAEEAFSVYDHAPVTLYRKTAAWSPERALEVLDPWTADAAAPVPDGAADANNAMLTPADRSATNDATFDRLFRVGGLLAVAVWTAWLAALTAAAVPAARRLLPGLGAAVPAVAMALGPIGTGLLTWSVVAWGVASFSAALVAVVTCALLALGGWMWGHDRRRLSSQYLAQRTAWRQTIAVAATVYVGVIVLRSLNPDLWSSPLGGEKPMELAYFTSIARSSTVPIPDPWYGGGALNYYYLGWYLLAVPARGLGIRPEVAFQLGLATFVALTCAISFAFAHDVTARTKSGRRRGPFIAGAVTVALLTVAGNLDTARQIVRWAVDGGRVFDWWAVSRAHRGTFDITEFPAWSTLFGDLHPHVMSWWISALVAVLCLALWAGPSTTRRRLLVSGVLGVVLGLARMVNTWDVPALTMIVAACLVASAPRSSWRDAVWGRVREFGIVAIVSAVVTSPYRHHTVVAAEGVQRAPSITSLIDHLVHVGPFLLLWAAWSLVWWRAGPHRPLRRLIVPAAGSVIVVAVGGFAVGSWAFAVTLAVVCGVVGVIACRSARAGLHLVRPDVAIVGLLAALGLALTIVGDAVIVSPDIVRMNTVFKFGEQGWVLLALASGPAVVQVVVSARLGGRRARALTLSVGAPVAVAMLLFPILAVGPRLDDRFEAIGPTVDGMAYLRHDPVWGDVPIADDLPLIEWARGNVPSDATIVELAGPAYGWNQRFSATTGLQSVVGWTWHQIQQRQGTTERVQDRTDEVVAFYRTRDRTRAARFLTTYGVEYVFIGTLERSTADSLSISVIEAIPGATTVFRSGDSKIVQIDLDETRRALAETERIPDLTGSE